MDDKHTENLNGQDQLPAASKPPTRAMINRANAQKSTGPRTPEGKARSSLNALRHGLTGHVIVMPGEDLAAYEAFVKEFFDQYQPQDPTERQLVQQLAETSWRLNRVAAHEENQLALGLHQHLDDFQTEHLEAQAALAIAAALRDKSTARALANLSIQDQRLNRKFFQVLKELQALQQARFGRQAWDMPDAKRLLKMHKDKGIPYNPAEDGFVFTSDAIETEIRRDQRKNEAAKADVARRGG